MHRIILAAAAALAMISAPALAQSTECPQGTTASSPDAGPVTCDNDDNTNDTTQTQSDSSAPVAPSKGNSPLDTTDAGQGVKDAIGGAGDNNNNNNNNN